MPYKRRENISSHKELLDLIITFKEIFCYIFYKNSRNPKIQIKVYNPEKEESRIFIIDTKYQRNTSSFIKNQYKKYITQYDYMTNIENIAEVSLITKGTVYGKQVIYYNNDNPWDSWKCKPEHIIESPMLWCEYQAIKSKNPE